MKRDSPSLAGRWLLLGALLVLHPGCQTETVIPVVDSSAFTQPLPKVAKPDLTDDATARLVVQPGSRYPTLFTPESFAVLLSADLLLERLEADAKAYRYPPVQVEFEAGRIRNLAAQFIICEVHLTSDFEDVGMAHDAVSLRNMQIALGNDTGGRVRSAAVQLGGSDEIDYVESTQVRRTSIILFPKVPTPEGPELIQPTTQALRLELTSTSSTFTAQWVLNPTFLP